MEPASTWKAVKPLVKALTPYAKQKLLGTQLDADLSKVVARAWESAARAMCTAAQPPPATSASSRNWVSS